VQSELAAEPAGELLCSVHPSLRPRPGQKKFAAQGAHPEGVDRSKPGAHRQCSGSVAAGADCVCSGHSEQTCCPLPLLYLPGAHAVQGADDDVKSEVLFSEVLLSEVLLSGACPASHSQGEPGAPVTLCSGHARHAFCWASWPGGQGWQPASERARFAGHEQAWSADAPVSGVEAPCGQGTQELLPTKDLYVLTGHGAHAEVEPSAAGACPSAHKHSLASTAPAKLVVGPGQAVQAWMPASGLKKPAAQGEQECPCAVQPGGHVHAPLCAVQGDSQVERRPRNGVRSSPSASTGSSLATARSEHAQRATQRTIARRSRMPGRGFIVFLRKF
jgi:hypothetical protein